LQHSRKTSSRHQELTKLKSDSTEGVSCGKKDDNRFVEINITEKEKLELEQHRHVLKNTFGWTRIDVLTMLIVCIFLAALCFSLLVEALQTLIHIDHQDTMHFPISVLILGCIGLVLNGLCYLLIGGYTYHQGSFLHLTSSGDVVLDRITTSGNRDGERELTKGKKPDEDQEPPKTQSTREMCRDSCSELVLSFSFVVY
jgi:solute carrier family 30 (zinc transporter), member 1